MHKRLSQDIAFIAMRSAKYFNSNRLKGLTFKEGDKVFVLRQNMKTSCPSKKLNHLKLGPYKITNVIRLVNYKVRLLK